MQIGGTKIKPQKQDIFKKKASFTGQASSARGEASTKIKQPRLPGRACRGSRGQNHPTNHSNTTHVSISAVSGRKMIKW